MSSSWGARIPRAAAMHLSKCARRVTMLVRGPSPAATMSQYLINQIAATPNMTLRRRTCVVEAHGETHLESITSLTQRGNARNLPTKSLFIFIGAQPHTDSLAGKFERDNKASFFRGRIYCATGVIRAAGLSTASHIYWRRACPVFSSPVTSAAVRSNGWHRALAKARCGTVYPPIFEQTLERPRTPRRMRS